MGQSTFSYADAANDAAGVPLTLSVFADRAHIGATAREDAEAAGFRMVGSGAIADLLDDAVRALGDVIMVDCPQPDSAALAALARIDLRAAHTGAQLIVSTTVAGLDDVFGCLDQSNPQILVDPSRADRVIALGRVLGRAAPLRLRELTEEDRLVLLRLTEQVGQIAQRLDRIDGPAPQASDTAFRFESPRPAFRSAADDGEDRLVRNARPPLPDPRLVRRIIGQRQMRARFFEGDLFGDPAWDMLLDLTAARVEHARVSVTSLCIASGVPPTTALRWIGQMTDAGLFQRNEDDSDRRRAFITLTDKAADAMARYFAALGTSAVQSA